jgi:DNA-binding IscR family transcriptional regulator
LESNNGQTKPVERLAEDLGKPLQTIRGHLWQARKRGFLKGSPGRKGGDLSIEAMTILQQMPKQPPSLIDADPPAGMEEGGSADR